MSNTVFLPNEYVQVSHLTYEELFRKEDSKAYWQEVRCLSHDAKFINDVKATRCRTILYHHKEKEQATPRRNYAT